jgi:hypothetical protein
MLDAMVRSSLTMFASIVVIGCAVMKPIVLDPIPPVEAASVSQPFKVVEPEKKIVPTITMHSGENCPPCKLWIARDMAGWQRLGWKVDVIKETTSTRLWPWYEVLDGDGLHFEVEGPLDRAKYERERKKALGK